LNLTANTTPQQDSAAQILTFIVNIQDPGPTTVISFSFSSLSAMTNTVTLAAVSQSFDLTTNSISTATAIASLCGPLEYSIDEPYSFLSVTASTISL